MSGLFHTPTAEMDTVGTARIGVHYIDRGMMPASDYFTLKDDVTGERHPFNTFSYYMSLTPFRWVELSYTCVGLARGPKLPDYTSKDRHFSVKFNPVREGKWWPSICIGAVDFMGSTLNPATSQQFFCNYYLSGSKHLTVGNGHSIALHASYRYYLKEYNKQFQGIVGGITFSPSFARNVRTAVEWDGIHVNCGVDALLWNHLLLQAFLLDGHRFSAGICFKTNLL